MHWPTAAAVGFIVIIAFAVALFVSRASTRPVRWGGESAPVDEPSKPDAE